MMRFIRYLIIAGFSYAIDLGCFLLFFKSQLCGPLSANILGKLISSIFSLFAHRWFTFKNKTDLKIHQQAWRFFVLVFLNVQFSSFLLMFNLHWIRQPVWAKIFTDSLCVMLSYWLSKTWIFMRQRA